MDFLKKFLANVLPVNQIIKFIIKQFLSSYLVIQENDLEEKPQENSGVKNLININDLELNVSNINHEHLLHSPIKLLKGKLGRFSLDITEENKIIITIEDVSIDLMPLFNYYKKYQETIFNMNKTKKEVEIQCEQENKNMAGGTEKIAQNNPKNQNNYMLNMANKLLTNLEINIKNCSARLFTYEISDKIPENPVFSLFIMNINIYKNDKNEKKESLIDPNTNQPFEETFLNNLIIEVDKLCIKVDQNKNNKDIKEFKELRKICNNKKLTKEQEERILGFFISYNTIFAMNYKKGPCLIIKLSSKPRKKNYKEVVEEKEIKKEKIIEDMNIEIDIFEAESIITPHQLFNIQILSQISNFIFTLNKNTPNKEDEEKEEINKYKTNKTAVLDKEIDNSKESNSGSSSGIFGKKKNEDQKINDNLDDIKMSFMPDEEEIEKTNINKKEEEKEKKMDILGHEISKINLTMNAKRIILVILENNNNESIPKLLSFLMEEEINKNKKNKNVKNSSLLNFDKSNESFENYYCYFEDNLLFVKIENINSINTSTNTSISVSSVIAEYIREAIQKENKNNDKEKEDLRLSKNKKSSIENSIYDSMMEYEDFKEADEDEDIFESAIENTELLIIENYNKYINKFLAGEYKSNKFEILIINEIKFNMTEKTLDIKEILLNLNYIIILLYVKLSTQIMYFIKANNPMFTNDDIIDSIEIEENENLNVNLEKKINDSENQLFKNLSKVYKKGNKSNEIATDNKDEMNISLNDSIDYSEEERNKKNGMKININYISIKIYNVAKSLNRFDTNIYYYKLFLELVYPNIIQKLNQNEYDHIEKQSFNELVSKEFIEIVLNDMNIIFYSISNTSKINIVFQEFLLKYWNYVVIQYNNTNKKNNINENPNVSITMPNTDIVVDFSEKVKINLEKNILDDLLKFNNTFLYGLSMYQIFDKYCGDLYKNKLLNLFDLFGLKNHFQLLKNIDDGNEIKINIQNSSKINKTAQEIQEIKQDLDNKPSMSIGGRIISCVININKNGTFDEKEGNLFKIKIVNIGVNLEMFSDNNNNNGNDHNKKNEPIYNNLSISISNIFFLIKENPLPKEGKPKYYNLFSKNKNQKYESIDYFLLSFKFRNIKKNRDEIIEEEENEDISENENENENGNKEKKENNLKKKTSKFELSSSKISLEKKTTDYIAFLLNNQVPLDNMEMVIDIKLSEIVFDSFYHKLNLLSSTLSDFYIEFTNKSDDLKDSLDGTYIKPSDLIPLCEERLMIIKCEFNISHLLIDIFLKEDKEQKNWMRLLFLIEKFKFTFNEKGLFLVFENNYVYIMKDFNYIYHLKGNLNKNELFEIEDKINEIHKEDSYLKRLGYVELFYNDLIKIDKLVKELNLNLGNMNLFFCQDTLKFILDFKDVFIENYLNKIKNIFSQDTLNSDDSSEEIEKDIIKNKKQKKEEKEEKKENKNEQKKIIEKKKEFLNDFEEVDDVFFMDDLKEKQKNKKNKNKKNPESKYLKKNDNSLKTIPEEKHSKNKKDISNEFQDDFTIIETKSSYERKELRKAIEEECSKYILELNSLRFYLFSGYDFKFEDDTNKDLDLSSSQNEENNINGEYNKEKNLEIDSNYLFKLTFKNKDDKKALQINKRKKNEERDYNNYILITLINLSFKIVDFYYFDFIIGNFLIDDNFEKSLYKKIISKQDYANEISKFLVCKIELIKNKEINKDKDVSCFRINLSLPSLDIFIDQLPLNFLINLILSQDYNKNEENENDQELNKKSDDGSNNNKDLKKKKTKNEDNGSDFEEINSKDSWDDEELEKFADSLTYINNIYINLFTINLHYNSHKISFSKTISNRDWLELLTGLADVKDLNLKFKSFSKNTQTPLSNIISEIIEFWKNDILNKQIANKALRGFSITRPFFKLYDGVIDLVWQPYKAYKENEGIKKGIKRGMKSFFVSFSSQGLFFGEKIVRGFRIVGNPKTKLSLKKKSLYKKWVYKIDKKQHDYEVHYYK